MSEIEKVIYISYRVQFILIVRLLQKRRKEKEKEYVIAKYSLILILKIMLEYFIRSFI